jgi:hypothetical protein
VRVRRGHVPGPDRGAVVSVVETLRRARERYADTGTHTPFGRMHKPGECCAVTALDFTGALSETPQNILGLAAGLAPDATGYRIPVIKWNAAASTDEVLAAYDRAIAYAEYAESA